MTYRSISKLSGHGRSGAEQIGRAHDGPLDHRRSRHRQGEAAKHHSVLQKLSYLIVIFVLPPLMIVTGWTMSPLHSRSRSLRGRLERDAMHARLVANRGFRSLELSGNHSDRRSRFRELTQLP